MTVGELIKALEKYPKDLEVFTKKNDICGNIGETFVVREDRYACFGESLPCVLIADFFYDEKEEEK